MATKLLIIRTLPNHTMTEISLLEVETANAPEFAVIWMHGLGADATDFEPIVPELGLRDSPGVRFVFPNAPHRPVTCNGGYVMRAWYDIVSLEPNSRKIDEAGLLESREMVWRLIAREIERGIPSHHIFLAGFSQGGAVAYLAGLTYAEPLAGIIALSTYIPAAELLTSKLSDTNRQLPIFAAHGTEDDVVSLKLGTDARDLLRSFEYVPEWHSYHMPHSVCAEEVRDIGAWLNRQIGADQA
jgi:phospholipase/carboxylesterase